MFPSNKTTTNKKKVNEQTMELLPLNGGGRLGGDIVDDSVDAADLVDDSVGDVGEEVVGESVPIGSHEIGGGHTTNGSDLQCRGGGGRHTFS